MRALVRLCLRFRFVVAVLALVFLVVGFRAAIVAPVDVFPEFAPPRVEIQTEVPGLSALEVETLVSTPIERAVHGIAFVAALRSKSVLGLSSVVLVFEEGTDLLRARQLVQERLGAVATTLPLGAKPPVMLSPLSSTSRVMKIGLSSKTRSQLELTDLARFTIRPRLMAVPGVANVAIWGERDRQMQILVDPDTLEARGVRLADVVTSARDATTTAAAGFVDTPTQRMAITHAPWGTTKEALGETPVPRAAVTAAPLRLADVARIEEGHPPPIGDAIIGDAPGLLLIVEKQPWGNTLAVTRAVEAALVELEPALVETRVDPTIFRPATFIERALRNLGESLVVGCVLVVVILVGFLRSFRTALLSAIAIPLSLVTAGALLAWRGLTIDTMTIAGLVIALGEVVDDAIIDVENILRRLAENHTRPPEGRRSSFAVVLDASIEVRSAVVYATLVVVLVFVPVYFLDGVSGAFFRPLAIAYVLAVAASLVVALTITPALALILLPSMRPNLPGPGPHPEEAPLRRADGVGFGAKPQEKDGPLSRLVLAAYRPIVVATVRSPGRAALGLAAVLALSVSLVPWLGEAFLPEFRETDLLMHWVGRPGTSVEEMARITTQASKELRGIAGVKAFGSHIGRAEVADEVVGPNFTELWISLDEHVDYEATVAAVQRTVDGYPGLQRDVQTYLHERMKEVLTGASGGIVVRIYGSDLATLRRLGEDVGRVLGAVSGVANLKIEPQVLVPQVEVRLDPAALQRFGATPGDVRRTIATLLQGTRVGEVYRGDQVLDVVVLGEPSLRSDVAAVRELRIATPRAPAVRLGDLGDVSVAPTPNVVQHDGASRRLDVTCDAVGRDPGAVARDVKEAVLGLTFPAGHHAEVLGEHAARGKAQQRLLALALLSLVGIGIVLYADFRSVRTVLFLLASLPFALVGGVVAVLCTGGIVSLGSLVGFVTVLGIAARNGILLVSHFRHLEVAEGMAVGPALVIRGALERVVPIAMTALATGLALVPLALAAHRPGSEIEHPMAVVILGGLVTSTVLNLVVVPALYLRWGRSAPRPEDA